jgi:protein SCO1/2
MNESAPRRAAALISLLLAVLLGACAPAEDPPLKGATMGGPLALTDQNGRRVTENDLAGKYRLVYFGYTFCPDVCPTDMARLSAGLRRFEAIDSARAARVQPIFVSVDPARDTPAVLRQFLAHFHPRFLGLTGSADEIARVARDYRIHYERGPQAGGGYLMNHSSQIVLYGPAGEPVALIPGDAGADAVAAEMGRWVR